MEIKISLLIPTFNRAELLNQALKSVARQTQLPYEVIIVDNASTDNTPEIVRRYAKYNFSYSRNKQNIGMVRNFNRCIRLATGTHLSFLHSDDLLSPDWCKTWVETIAQNQAGVYTSSLCTIDAQNNVQFVYRTFKEDSFIKQPAVTRQFIDNYAPILAPTGATVFDKKVFDELGLFDPAYSTEYDVPFSLKLLSRYDLYYKDKILFAHRFHPEQTFDKEKQQKSVASRLQKMENYFRIVRDYYEKELVGDQKDRRFLLTHLFMTLCSNNLYLVKLELARVFGAQKIAKKVFPDLYTQLIDWIILLKIQALFIKRALSRRRFPPEIQKQVAWLRRF